MGVKDQSLSITWGGEGRRDYRDLIANLQPTWGGGESLEYYRASGGIR